MLGIRRIKDRALDLWLGDPKRFVADETISLTGGSLDSDLGAVTSANARHLAVDASSVSPDQINHLCKKMIDILSTEAASELERLTIVVADQESYDVASRSIAE